MAINLPCTVNFNGQTFTATLTLENLQSFPAALRHPEKTDAATLKNLLITGEIGVARTEEKLYVKLEDGQFLEIAGTVVA